MNNEILLSLIKYLCVSSVLYLVYLLLLKGRLSYRLHRVVLLSIPILSLMFSLWHIEIKVDNEILWAQIDEKAIEDEATAPAYDNFEIIYGNTTPKSHTAAIKINWWWIAWGAVAMGLLLRYVSAVRYIFTLRSLSKKEWKDRYAIYRCGLVESPFSFLRSIYIDRKIEGEKLDIVLSHESAHISHNHFVDKVIIETMVMVSWFNPIVWIIRKELCAVHEFEADQVVLVGFPDIKRYQQFLFDEASGAVPRVANGFNNSMLKQRFLEMKRRRVHKSNLLRNLLAGAAVLGVVIALSFTTYLVGKDAPKVEYRLEQEPSEAAIQGGNTETRDEDVMTIAFKDGPSRILRGEEIERFSEIDPETIKSISIIKASQQTEQKDKPTFYDVTREQYMITEQKPPKSKHMIYRCDGYTEVDFMLSIPQGKNWWWCGASSEYYLVDPKSGDRYKIHSTKSGIPLDQYVWIRDQAGYTCVITNIFPPLKKGVDRVDIVEYVIPGPRPSHNDGLSKWVFRDVPVQANNTRSYRDIEMVGGEVIALDPDFKIK